MSGENEYQTSRRKLLQTAATAGTIAVAGCANNDDQSYEEQEYDDQQNNPDGEPEADIVKILNGEPEEAGAEPAKLLDRPVLDQEAQPTLYHDTANIPDGTEITLELDHQPYPEAETPEQHTTTLNAELTGNTTHLDLQNYQPGKYQATTTIQHPNGQQLHQNQQTIYITPTTQKRESIKKEIEEAFKTAPAGRLTDHELKELNIAKDGTSIYIESESKSGIGSEELFFEASAISGSHAGATRVMGTPYSMIAEIETPDGEKNVEINSEAFEEYLEGEGRPHRNILESQFDIN